MSVIDVMNLSNEEVVYWSAYFELIRREDDKNKHKPGPKQY
jgi:hypothetical protein